MAISAMLSHGVLVITAGVLLYVALTDLKQFKILDRICSDFTRRGRLWLQQERD